jgi:hypothetical protein
MVVLEQKMRKPGGEMNKGLILGMAAAIAIPSAYAGNVIVNSSTAITFLSNGTSTTTDFSSLFTTANFTSAQTGPNAALLTTTPFYTTAAALTTAGAQWIGTSAGAGNGSSAGYTALYSIDFTIPVAFVSGSLTLDYEVDNELGDLNAGIYLNGSALPSSTAIPGSSTSSFGTLQTYTDNNVTADLVQGTNWLYIDAVNLGAEGGLIFSADISTVDSVGGSAPEPATLWLLGAGVAALGARSWRRPNGPV